MKFLILTLIYLMFANPIAYAADIKTKDLKHGVYVGMTEEDFIKIYSLKTARTYRQDGPDEWITFNQPSEGPTTSLITFHLMGGQIRKWKTNDRKEVIKEYLGEFCSIGQNFPKIYTAIEDVLERIPFVDFLNVTNRQRPMIFTEFYDSGTARFASSQEMILTEDDAPCCAEGFTIVKLGLGLNGAESPVAIEGVVAHELAHRVLDHIRKGNINCDAERQSNRLIKKWGFTKEFAAASKAFGQKKGDPAACQEKKH